MRTVEYLDELAKLTETGSDYAVSKLLGLSRQWISHYRNGRTFSDETAVKVAQLLGIPEGVILADMHAERAASGPVAEAWRHAAEVLRKSAAAVVAVAVLVGGLVLDAPPAGAAQPQNTVYYVKSRRRFRELLDFLLDLADLALSPL